MNKKAIISLLLTLVAMTGQGQELKIDDQGELEIDVRSGSQSQIKRVSASLEDFMEHMAMYGYDVYTYDISSLRDSASGFTIVIREYDQQKMIDEKKLYGFRTKTMISDFNKQDQKNIYEEKDGDDMERGIYRLSKTLSIGFSPIQSDSIETITLRSSRNDAAPWKLTLKPITEASQPFTVIRECHTSPLLSPLTPSFPLFSMVLSGGTSNQKESVSVETQN